MYKFLLISCDTFREISLKMDTKLTFADIVKRAFKNNKTKPNPPHKKTLKNEQLKVQQKLVKDLPKSIKLNQNQLQQPVFDQLPVRKVENKFIDSVHGNKFEDRYQVGSKLGQGGQGSVYSGNLFLVNT